MKDRFNRDEMFYRLAHLNVGLEKKEDVLNDLRKVLKSQIFLSCNMHRVKYSYIY